MKNPRRQCGESNNGKKEREKADRQHEIEGALAWKESRNRLGGIDEVAHMEITYREARCAMKL